MAAVAASRCAAWRSGDTVIPVNTDLGTSTKSQSLVAVCATRRRRASASVPVVPTNTLAAGYHCFASRPTCSMMWLGTTIHGWDTNPRRFSSIAPISIVPVFPAPTT